MYSWIDTSRDYQLALSFNTPLLEELCHKVAQEAGIPVTEEAVGFAKTIFIDTMTGGFKEAVRLNFGDISIDALPMRTAFRANQKPRQIDFSLVTWHNEQYQYMLI